MANNYFKPEISKNLKNFLDKNENTIVSLLEIIKKNKPNIPNSYFYSQNYPPSNPNYKYTEKLYIGCIFYVIKNAISWTNFIGPINGKLLNERHNKYIKNSNYDKFFKLSLKKYSIKNTKSKNFNIDSTIINNKQCKEIDNKNRLPINKNRRGLKISVITDDKGSPINVVVCSSTVHDAKIAHVNLDSIKKDKNVSRMIHKNKTNFLADKGYVSKTIEEKISKLKMRPIIPSRKNSKKQLSDKQNKILKKRIKVEHLFGIIKNYPKINCVYEKKIKSYLGCVLFVLGSILIGRTVK